MRPGGSAASAPASRQLSLSSVCHGGACPLQPVVGGPALPVTHPPTPEPLPLWTRPHRPQPTLSLQPNASCQVLISPHAERSPRHRASPRWPGSGVLLGGSAGQTKGPAVVGLPLTGLSGGSWVGDWDVGAAPHTHRHRVAWLWGSHHLGREGGPRRSRGRGPQVPGCQGSGYREPAGSRSGQFADGHSVA